MHFAALPDQRAAQHPDGPALADEQTGQLTNAQLLNRVQTTAAHLAAAGVGPGDVVAVQLPNRVELVITLFAAWRLGAVITPVNPSLTPDETAYQLDDSAARLLVCERGPTTIDRVVLTLPELSEPADTASVPAPEPSQDDVALLIYTSGSTGRPKGVELTHTNIAAMARSMIEFLQMDSDSHSLLVLPLFHVNGIVVSVLSPLLAGGQTTVAGRFNPQVFFEIVERVRPTMFSAVPTIYTMLLALPADATPDTSSLRYAVCGAAPMPVELIRQFETRYRIPIIEGYGLSEGTCASTCNPIEGPRKAGTVGVPVPGVQVAIMNRRGEVLSAGSPGEVVVKGPTVMRGYLNRPEETAHTIIDGWLHTGDIGFLDADGYLSLVDRVKDVIIRGGENIYPKEIESAIYTYPGVQEAAVVGRPDPVYGEEPVAFVSFRSAGSADGLLDHLRAKLAQFKLPVEIIVVDELPKNPVGKISKPALRRRFTVSAN